MCDIGLESEDCVLNEGETLGVVEASELFGALEANDLSLSFFDESVVVLGHTRHECFLRQVYLYEDERCKRKGVGKTLEALELM